MQSYSGYCMCVAAALLVSTIPAFSGLTSSEVLLIDRCWTGTQMDSIRTVVYRRDHTLRIQELAVGTTFSGTGTWQLVGRKLSKRYKLRMDGSFLPPWSHSEVETIRELTTKKLVTDWYSYDRADGNCNLTNR
jgi:hypothetical protein